MTVAGGRGGCSQRAGGAPGRLLACLTPPLRHPGSPLLLSRPGGVCGSVSRGNGSVAGATLVPQALGAPGSPAGEEGCRWQGGGDLAALLELLAGLGRPGGHVPARREAGHPGRASPGKQAQSFWACSFSGGWVRAEGAQV